MTTSDDQQPACDRRTFFRRLTTRGIDQVQQAGLQFIEQRRRLAQALTAGEPAAQAVPDPPDTTGPQAAADHGASDQSADPDATDAKEPLKLGASPRPVPSGAVARTGAVQRDSR